jgi:phospholipase/carboxylesterase
VGGFHKTAPRAADECSVFVPVHYEANYSYPLIVWLHSNGDDSLQLHRVMPSVSIRNYIGVAPQAPAGDTQRGFFWDQTPATIESAHASVMMAIDHASVRFNISQPRIFVAGFGAGGEMAFRIAFQRPELFAGVISINGPLPVGHAPLADLSLCRDLPVFWAHCRQSIEFLQDDLCKQLKLLHVAGFSVTLRQYPVGDQLFAHTLSDMDRWIMEAIQTMPGANIIR